MTHRPPTFEPLVDDAALACVRYLESKGSVGVITVASEGCRIVRSMDDVPHDGFTWHVSVSRNGKPVSWELAERFAKELAPAVEKWDRYEKGEKATHLWENKHATP